jgi:peptidoglycan/LPS O-acetylase OafA/YrhL
MWGVPAVLVTLSFIKARFVSATVNRILVPVGNASYSIYLTHPMTMIVFAFLMKHHVLGAMHIPIVLPLVVVTAVVFGVLAHYLVERPILSWLRGQFRARPKPAEEVNHGSESPELMGMTGRDEFPTTPTPD